MAAPAPSQPKPALGVPFVSGQNRPERQSQLEPDDDKATLFRVLAPVYFLSQQGRRTLFHQELYVTTCLADRGKCKPGPPKSLLS